MQLPEARENARDQVAIGFRFGWKVSAGFLDKWHGVVNKNHQELKAKTSKLPENAKDQVAIGFRFGWEFSAGFLDKWHGVVNKNH